MIDLSSMYKFIYFIQSQKYYKLEKMLTTVQIETTDYKCDVCGDKSCNWYYGAIVCEACKKFFVRSQTESREEYNCERFLRLSKYCVINIETRRDCKFCRYQKCLKVGLDLQSK